MFVSRFRSKLTAQRQAGLYRNPPAIEQREGRHLFIGREKVLNFASNDYLGLSVSEGLKRKVAANFMKYGTSSSSSRLVSGHYGIIRQAEKEYADYFGYADALFFPSGYQANLGLISGLFEPGDELIFDKHIHASSVKGMALSGARFKGYRHNSMTHLEKRLQNCETGQAAVLTESLFSMDGDTLNIEKFLSLKKRYGFLGIVDEAHAFGALGPKGTGLAREVADVATGTFGKALGLFGAFVLLPEGFKEYLFNFSSPLIYTTTLPEAHAASAIDLLEIVARSDQRRHRLTEVCLLMKNGLNRAGFKVSGHAHIIAVEIGEENRTLEVSRHLLSKNIFALPARYPTVPMNHAILRIGMTALHRPEDVEYFINTLKEITQTL